MLEEQKRRAEHEAKQRRIQEQQKRLKEFSAIGGRKMDADSLIDSILGPKPGQTRQQGPQGAMPPGMIPGGGMPPGGMPPPPSYNAVLQIKASQGTNGVQPPQQGMNNGAQQQGRYHIYTCTGL